MIGNINKSVKDVVIIGAGASGLIAGYLAKKNGYNPQIFEKSIRSGGLINTKHTEFGKVEYAAHMFRIDKLMLEICKHLDVELVKVQAKKKLFIKNGKTVAFPFSLSELLTFLVKGFFSRNDISKSGSLAEFTRLSLGEAGLKYFITPISRGIYGTNPENLSPMVLFQGYVSGSILGFFAKKRKNSLGTCTCKGGTVDFITKLEKYLKPNIVYGTEINSLEDFKGKNIILAGNANSSAGLLEKTHKQIANQLKLIEYSELVLLHLFLKKDDIKSKFHHTLGALSTDYAASKLMGILFTSEYSCEDSEVFSVMAIFSKNNILKNDLVEEVLSVLEVESSDSVLYSEVATIPNAIPIYSNALFDIVNARNLVKEDLAKDNILLCGNYLGKLALNDILSGIYGVF